MSLNLSFKDWPFLPINKYSQNNQIKPTTATNEETDLFNFPLSIFSGDIPQMKSILQSIKPQQSDENFPDSNTYANTYHLSSWGPCGLFACTYEGSVSILSSDNNGCLTPIQMFSPFEKYSFDKISKQPQKSANITAIGWSNGHLEPYMPKPILAISSDKGYVLLYNVKTRNVMNSFNFNEPITSILWSSYKVNRFYVGTSIGHFYVCEVYKKSIEILKMFTFSEDFAIISDSISKSVDFIAQDDVDGYTVAIASKDGTVGYIQNLNDISKTQLRIFTNLNFSGSNKKSNVVINFVEFYPNNQNFIFITTNTSTFIFSILKTYLIPFINRTNCLFISIKDDRNDTVFIGDSSSIAAFRLEEKSWIKMDELKIPEILTFSKHDDKILLTTFSSWLTEIEYKRNKLFVTRRIKINNGKPIDYDFGDGTIAFLTNHNSFCLTTKTPESINRSKFTQEKSNTSNCGNSNSISLSFNILPTEENDKIKNIGFITANKLIAWCEKSLYLIDLQTRTISEQLKKIFDRLSNKLTQLFFSKSCKLIGMILNHEQAYFLDANLDIVYSIDFNGIINKDCQCLFGSISPNEDQVVFSSQSALFFSNLKEKTPLKKINSNLKFNASFISWTEKGIIIGTEKGSAFLIRNSKIETLSEISKKDVKVIYDSLHIDEYSNQNKLGPIKSIIYDSEVTNSYIIIDSNGQGIIASHELITMPNTIDIIKRISDETFLVSFQNYNKLIAINIFDDFVPQLPPCFNTTQANNISFYSNKKDLIDSIKNKDKINSIIKRIFTSNEINHSFILRNNIQFLNHILSFYETFNFLSSRIFLKLGNLEMARNILLKSNKNNKEYLNCMLIAAFYENSNNDSIQLIVKNLMSNNMVFDAADILLITKDVFSAVKILFEAGKNKEAYYVLMLSDVEKESNEMKEIAKKIADDFIAKKENVLFGLKLLSSFGFIQEMLDKLSLCLS